jgi:outer membrane protein
MLRHLSAALIAISGVCLSQNTFALQTPPVLPRTVETPVPPPILVPGPTPPPDVPNRPLTADEAARIALRFQPNVVVARANVLAAQGRTQQARSGLLPNVSASAGYTHNEFLSGSGGPSSTAAGGFDYNATVRQLIFDFDHTRNLVRQAAALERVAGFALTQTQADLVLTVKQGFYNYVQAARLVKVEEADVKNRQDQLALARARLNSGLGQPVDVVSAETAVAAGVSMLTLARNTANLAHVSLALQMGIDPRTPFDAADTDEPLFPADDVDGLVKTALKSRPEVLGAQANVSANRYAVNAARTNNAPVIAGTAGVGANGANFLGDNTLVTVGASISFSPYDGGYTAGLVKTARANETAAQAQLAAQQLNVTSDVTQAYYTLRNAEQRVQVANNEVTNATEQLRIAEGRYRNGLGLFQDILTAQAALVQAHNDQVTTQISVDNARAAINHAIGNALSAK